MASNNKMYKITLRKRAAKEYLQALTWYKKRSLQAAESFIKAVNEAFENVELKPEQYRNFYKNFHEIKTRKYPFVIVYFIDKEKSIIIITTIFHNKRNPERKF